MVSKKYHVLYFNLKKQNKQKKQQCIHNNGDETIKTNQRQMDSHLKRNGHTRLFLVGIQWEHAFKLADFKASRLHFSGIKSMTWLGCAGWRFGFDTVEHHWSKPKLIISEELLKPSHFIQNWIKVSWIIYLKMSDHVLISEYQPPQKQTKLHKRASLCATCFYGWAKGNPSPNGC